MGRAHGVSVVAARCRAGFDLVPVAIPLATGAIWQSAVLTLFGVFVIGILVDNVLRPILVAIRTPKMPDYVVLISTLGGMALFGLTGFVIGPVIAALFMACWDLFAPAGRFWSAAAQP